MNRGGRRQVVVATVRVVALALGLAGVAVPVLAHGGSLGQAGRRSLTVPTWLVVGTGGAAVGASFLLASFATDRRFVAALHAPRRHVSVPAWRALRALGGATGVMALVGVVVTGFVGPSDPLSNPAVLVVWAGWWAGFAMSTYLLGNAWLAVNPWRTIARVLPDVGRAYAWRWGAWPSVAGLLALIWLEVVSPLADRPPVLAVTVLAYTTVTLGGAVVYGPGTWFGRVDPVSRVFRLYGQVAPVGVDGTGVAEKDGGPLGGRLSVRVPGSALTDDILSGRDEVAFVVALLWVTTFDGVVTTPAWETVARAVVGAGVPAAVVYPAALVAGFGLFWGLYVGAARRARRTAPTYVDAPTLARRFAPPLLAIAVGYHLAHFLDYFLSLVPALALAVTAPMATVDPPIVVVPGWFGGVAIGAILVGHVLAVLAAHAVAFELFPDRLQAIRSQYPFIAVMVLYTMASLWVVTRPEVPPPYL
jgi:hypothetical protein